MVKILSIIETTFKFLKKTYEGYVITTEYEEIKIGVEQESQCCEVFGFITSEDDIQSFVGKSLRKVSVVDTALNETIIKGIKKIEKDKSEDANTMFINFETSDGTLQFVAYNAHNGYYGHNAVVLCEDVVTKKRL